MANYVYIESSLPLMVVEIDLILSLPQNPLTEAMVKIAIALEEVGIDGIYIRHIQVKNQFVKLLSLREGSLGERLLDAFIDGVIEKRQIPTIEQAIEIAKRVQENEAHLL